MTRSVFRETFGWFDGMYWRFQKMLIGGIFAAVLVTIRYWKVMIPFWVLVALVGGYLRYSRGTNSL